ncbi:MAG: tRNA (cytidine(34)-2'-O)-methyltransferase [Proteobacteria bacterium]|nr:tRNA (cytidine(34)-2'-O)-methyltransferase [Pseudomonadota bacterium]MBI3497584.1 tRNA (cytidine(34)-2'-O)-methyltransferase [Pseudomonadota bacterium]
MRLVLYEPDIAENTGAILRLAACLAVPVDLVEPAGFVLDDRRLRRVGMDYVDQVRLLRHTSWQRFLEARPPGRLVLLTTKAAQAYTDFAFAEGDALLLGRESAGVPASVHALADARIKVPMQPLSRSLNIAVAAAMVLGEALRQTAGFPGGFPGPAPSPTPMDET